MHVYQTANVTDAVEMAVQFKKEGRYNWFRGQTHMLPPTPTFLRLNRADRRKAEQRFKRYCAWMLNTPGLEHLRENIDGAIAVAQHYGLPTGFLDFTRSPAVAGYFSSTEKKRFKAGTACIFCLNTRDLVELWGWVRKVLPHYPDIEQIEVDVPNLWRLEAQDGVFLRCPLNWDRHYPLDRIEFPLGNRPSYPTNDQIYPERQSHLEQLLDHFFSVEHLRDFRAYVNKTFPDAEVLECHAPSAGFHAEFFVKGGPPKRRDWAKSCLVDWLTVPSERLHSTATGEITLRLDKNLSPGELRQSVAYGVRRTLDSQPALRKQAVRWWIEGMGRQSSRTLTSALDRLWNGVRHLPFHSENIADGIGLCCALHVLKFHKATQSDERVAIAQRCLGDCFVVEMSSWNGSNARAIVADYELSLALRAKMRSRLKPKYWEYEVSPRALLQLCWEPRRLFVFEPFSRLFVTQIAPTQVLMSQAKASHFSPARIVGFGLP